MQQGYVGGVARCSRIKRNGSEPANLKRDGEVQQLCAGMAR